MPKLPPMSPHTTRILLSGTFSTLCDSSVWIHVRALQRGVDGVAILDRLVDADAAARLHRRRRDAVDDETMLRRRGRPCEGRIGLGLVALDLDEADVVRAVVPDERHAGLDRVARRDDRRQRFVVDFDQLGGIDAPGNTSRRRRRRRSRRSCGRGPRPGRDSAACSRGRRRAA